MKRLTTTLLAGALAISSPHAQTDDLSRTVAEKIEDTQVGLRKNAIGNIVDVSPEDNTKMIAMLDAFFQQINNRPYTKQHFYKKSETDTTKVISVSNKKGNIRISLDKISNEITYVFDGEERGLVESLEDMKRLLRFIAESIQWLDERYKGIIKSKPTGPIRIV